MILKSLMIVKDRSLAALLSEKIKNHGFLQLIPFDERKTVPISNLSTAVDIVFYEVTEDEDVDLETVLTYTDQFKSVVLIFSCSRTLVMPYPANNIEYMFSPILPYHIDLVIQKIATKICYNKKNRLVRKGEFMMKDIVRKEKVWCSYEEITVIEVMDKSLKIHTAGKGVIESNGPLSKIEKWLEPVGIFYRVHKSFIISSNYIESVTRDIIKIKHYNRLIKMGARYRKSFDEFSDSITFQ